MTRYTIHRTLRLPGEARVKLEIEAPLDVGRKIHEWFDKALLDQFADAIVATNSRGDSLMGSVLHKIDEIASFKGEGNMTLEGAALLGERLDTGPTFPYQVDGEGSMDSMRVVRVANGRALGKTENDGEQK